MQIAATLVKGKARINFQENKKVCTSFTNCTVLYYVGTNKSINLTQYVGNVVERTFRICFRH